MIKWQFNGTKKRRQVLLLKINLNYKYLIYKKLHNWHFINVDGQTSRSLVTWCIVVPDANIQQIMNYIWCWTRFFYNTVVLCFKMKCNNTSSKNRDCIVPSLNLQFVVGCNRWNVFLCLYDEVETLQSWLDISRNCFITIWSTESVFSTHPLIFHIYNLVLFH